jgi:hypothetical protein
MAVGAVQVLAGCGNVEAATLSGTWQLRITVSAYTGGPATSGEMAVGTTAGATVDLCTSCTATGQCTAQIRPASSSSSSELYDNTTGWYWDPQTALTHNGSSYLGVVQGGGYGGPNLPACHPPAAFDTYPTTLTVPQASEDASGGWHAAVVSGSQTTDIGWACSAGAGVVSQVRHLSLLAVPAGTSFPTSLPPACATAVHTNPAESSISSGLDTPAEALGSIASLVVAVIAWLIWVPVGHAAGVPGAPLPIVVLADMLAAIFVSGLVGTVIMLMPLRLLPGATLAAWNRWAWAVTFGGAVFGLVEVVLHSGSTPAHPGKAAIVTAVLLFVVFGGMTVGLRWYFSHRKRSKQDAEEGPVTVGADSRAGP